jgi:hypothetical protein
MRSIRLLLVIAALATAVAVVNAAAPAGAQAQLVSASVNITPAIPDPGDDVTVAVRATGCPPGNALMQVYLTASDGATVSAALMAEQEARSTLFFRAKAEIELPDALEGWYGVRVVCGQFRPEREPMANTQFRVGANPTKEMRVLVDEVEDGGVIPVEGNGCPGHRVELDMRQSGLRRSAFLTRGEVDVDPEGDGTWGSLVAMPADLNVGKAEVRGRCVIINEFGDSAYINYGGIVEITIVAAPPDTLPPNTEP